jgi:riboflavin synthase
MFLSHRFRRPRSVLRERKPRSESHSPERNLPPGRTPTGGVTARARIGGMDRIGVADTMFARYDMGSEAVDELESCPGHGERFEVVRRTVPGFKDLGVACKKLIEEEGCHIVVALGMPGKAAIDQVCAHEASQGIMLAQLLTNTHVLEVFVHENEEEDPARLAAVCVDRARKHARNAYWMLYEPEQLNRRAGQGIRQGYSDAGPLVDSARPTAS